MDTLKVALVQSALHWQDIPANLAMFEEKLADIDEDAQVIVLPEMFTTGFTMDSARLAEPGNFTTLRWMRLVAERRKAAVTGSFIVKSAGRNYNRMYWVNPDGETFHYDKRHLFRMAEEHRYFAAGESQCIITFQGWRIAPFICYDLRFPVWNRNRIADGEFTYDVAVYVANWPKQRINAWETLLVARAMENACYVCGVNRVGKDGNGIEYNGRSLVSDPKGTLLVTPTETEQVVYAELDKAMLQNYRQKFPVHLDGDDFTLK